MSDDATYNVAADELRQFIEQIEGLEAEKKDLTEQIREIYAEAKARGYDAKAMRSIVSLRKRDKAVQNGLMARNQGRYRRTGSSDRTLQERAGDGLIRFGPGACARQDQSGRPGGGR